MLMRQCVRDFELNDGQDKPTGVTIKAGQWVAAVIAAANVDSDVFKNPRAFIPAPSDPAGGPGGCPVKRNAGDYMLFGAPKQDPSTREVVDRNRSCWGRDKMAMYIVTSCLEASRELGRMRRVPGPNGEPKEFARVMIGLPARFPRKR